MNIFQTTNQTSEMSYITPSKVAQNTCHPFIPDGKYKNITSNMKFVGGWNADLSNTTSDLYNKTKKEIETQVNMQYLRIS